jgi:hypothetical protein
MKRALPDLHCVMLEDCFVLGWSQRSDRLVFELEASLHPGHPMHETPKGDDWACYKRATLSFEGVKAVKGLLSVSEAKATTDPDGTKDYGNIDALSATTDGYEIAGGFGQVTVQAQKCIFLVA